MFKKVVSAIMCMILVGTATSCNAPAVEDNGKLNIVATIFPQYDFARAIVGEYGNVTMLVSPGAESHSYEPTPADIITVQNADVFICGGGISDVWSNNVLKSIDTKNMKIIKLMDIVEPIAEEHHHEDGAAEKHGHDADKPQYDEHVWTSIRNSIKITEEIYNSVVLLDKENADNYSKNYKSYVEKLDTLDKEFETAVQNGKNKMLIFGDRFPFRYFANDYGLEHMAAFDGCSSETDASAAVMSTLIDEIKTKNIPVVYYIEFSSKKIADAIATETGAKPLLLHSCHSVSREDFDSGVTYFDLMTKNLENLKKGIN